MMRLRRLELVFVGLTLAFLIFLGGFFTGRSYSPVNIEGVASLQIETTATNDIAVVEMQVSAYSSGNVSSADDNNLESGSNNMSVSAPDTGLNSNQNDSDNQSAVAPGAPRGGDGRININTASKNELMDLPGIGPSLADNIVQHRNSNGAFNTIEDIMNVSGIAEGRFSRIRDRITV